MAKDLYVVHCIDAEGPLFESLEATFERINYLFGTALEPSRKTLHEIQEGRFDLGGKEAIAKRAFAPDLLAYNDTWDKIDGMLDEMMGEPFRIKYSDSMGGGWIYNWFSIDHVGYSVNPRRRDVGYHNIFDHYNSRMKDPASKRDEIHWHFHPKSTYSEGHICATSFLNSPHLLEGLSRRVVDRAWFPACFRAGFHTERPDSHWFLEQFIPFDFSNQGMQETILERGQPDMTAGRFGDWRRAPSDWSHYNPDHDDYQNKGGCRRTIFRCLNVGTRVRLLDEAETEKAFARANSGQPTILAFTNHDFRDMRKDVEHTFRMIADTAKKYPEVRWRHAGAKNAAQAVLGFQNDKLLDFEVTLRFLKGKAVLTVEASREIFGPQPFLAIKTVDRRFFSDNFDFDLPRMRWSYTFDEQTVGMDAIETIGVAANTLDGSTCVINLDAKGSVFLKRNL